MTDTTTDGPRLSAATIQPSPLRNTVYARSCDAVRDVRVRPAEIKQAMERAARNESLRRRGFG